MLQLGVMTPFLFALFVPFLFKAIKKVHTGWFVLFIPVSLFIFFLRFIPQIKAGEAVKETMKWIPSLHINFDLYLDGLSFLFVLLITGIGSLIVLYSIFYLHKNERLNNFYVFLLLFMGAMLGVVLSDNLFVLYGFWELTSLSSFLLIGYWYHKERSRYGALKSMMITVFGGLMMLGGFILMSIETNTTSIRTLLAQPELILQSEHITTIIILVLLGAFTKSAQFPFHIWLPDAMEAPTPVSAYLHSATMVKAGLYIIARFTMIFHGHDLFFVLVTGIGIITLCVGSYLAPKQHDLKGILAFSTISQLGMVMTMLGFGTKAAIFAAVFHIINHATFKGSLFMLVGIVDHEAKTRDIRKLGGLYTLMPITATLAFFGTFSMAGVPLPIFNGFLSKEMFFASSLHLEGQSGIASTIVPFMPYLAVFGSIFTFVYSMKLFFGTFFGKTKIDTSNIREPKLGMLVSPIILVALVIFIGLFPNTINQGLLTPAASSILGEPVTETIHFWHGFTTAFMMSLAVIMIGTLLYVTREKWKGIYNIVPGSISFNKWYDQFFERLYRFSTFTMEKQMSGSLRSYMLYIFTGMLVLLTTSFLLSGPLTINTNDIAPIGVAELLTGLMMAIAAIAVAFIYNRIAAILVLGVVGYGLALLFVFFKAPDLALTQLVIETITVVLFLLAFKHLPSLKKGKVPKSKQFVNWIISIAIGGFMTVIALSAHSHKLFAPISDYFLKTSVPLGGGHNVVNVILVDMRGLDTMFEITVLGIAALGIYTLIKLRDKGGSK
ncbi:Na+/H+ antiporter subunit A [Massilibacterium senegalense]|uniref:Na+/H+ antiporter subunit A n=1 Tax=Massilibacterium senegalense TaxID=1632858 RepID=UPI000780BEB4|nr:Na+/H+ antiporter subunit A [Massilibacterium senegalense]